ncbi:hypothetical protein Lepto7375DRAFT_6802 [Leptolyngbya sp. PCC 7375]|nr:hypothetical protein Lepto7375DRAFT_6802 [Leptolyngbya sp. PCC 7375]
MDKNLKRKIRKFWRDRLIIGLGSLSILGFASVQALSVFNYRPVQPSWVLEFSQSVEVLTQERRSREEKEKAILDIKKISSEHNLQTTEAVFHYLERNLALDWDLTLALSTALELNLAIEQDFALDQNLTQALEQNQGLIQDLDWALALDRALDKSQNQNEGLTPDLVQDLSRDRPSNLIDELVNRLEQANNSLLMFTINEDLEQAYGFTLKTGNILKNLLENEPIRAGAFTTSMILLGVSLLVLLSFLVFFGRVKGSLRLPGVAHIIAFLPEEYVAELGYLQHRLKKSKATPWQIRRRLIHEFVLLIWAYYIQVQLDNLFLDSNQDHTIDD